MDAVPYTTSLIETLIGSNFKQWKKDVEIVLGLMDLDLILKEDMLATLTDASTATQRNKFEK